MASGLGLSFFKHSRPTGEVTPAEFFARGSDEVATDLIGKVVWRTGFGGGRLTEVEAYLPVGDEASHAAPGKTRRNAAMFGPPGRLYVFLSYGVHFLLNFVCDTEGVGAAVLVRSFEPLAAEGMTAAGQGARGPGVVGRALGISLEMSGCALGEESGMFVLDDGFRPATARAIRVGISRGQQLPLRHYMLGSRYVSGPARLIEEK
jgi:DNA-3-methyladenine glycosylase